MVGERRYRAAQQAGLDTVPVIIRDYSDDQVLELNVIENVQREDLSAVEKGRVCRELLERFPEKYPNQKSLADRLGIDRATMAHWIQTTELPEPIQRMIAPEAKPIGGRPPTQTVDYETALRVPRQVRDHQRAMQLLTEIAGHKIPLRQAVEIARRAAREPERPVGEIVAEELGLIPWKKTRPVPKTAQEHLGDIMKVATRLIGMIDRLKAAPDFHKIDQTNLQVDLSMLAELFADLAKKDAKAL